MSLVKPESFFDSLRAGILGPRLDPGEVDGCNAIMVACAGWPVSWVAYAMATAYHETAHTMQPIKEYGGDKYFFRMYDKAGDRPHIASRLGNTQPGDGVKYAGRGLVQITGRANYAKAERELGVPFVSNPDMALVSHHAAKIMRRGMEEGWFTGKRLKNFLPMTGPATQKQFKAARPIINGTDRADDIAVYAVRFQNALMAGGWD